MTPKEYFRQLKDPRWQKRRLEILTRDDFTCRECQDNSSTLHVHHTHYVWDQSPWEASDKYLITLCKDCHEEIGRVEKEYIPQMMASIKACFYGENIRKITKIFQHIQEYNNSPAVINALENFFDDGRLWEIVECYCDKSMFKTDKETVEEKRIKEQRHETVLEMLKGMKDKADNKKLSKNKTATTIPGDDVLVSFWKGIQEESRIKQDKKTSEEKTEKERV